MTSEDNDKNVFDLYSQGSTSQTIPQEPTKEYKAFENADGVNSIIINFHDGKTHQIFYSSFAGIGVISNSDEVVSLVLTGNVIILEGRNLRGIHKRIQSGTLSAINTLRPHHIKPTDEKDEVVEKITLAELRPQEDEENEV